MERLAKLDDIVSRVAEARGSHTSVRERAEALGIKIVDEQEFIKMLEETGR